MSKIFLMFTILMISTFVNLAHSKSNNSKTSHRKHRCIRYWTSNIKPVPSGNNSTLNILDYINHEVPGFDNSEIGDVLPRSFPNVREETRPYMQRGVFDNQKKIRIKKGKRRIVIVRDHHDGLDYSGPCGAPVFSQSDGIVAAVSADMPPLSNYGNSIVICKPNGNDELKDHQYENKWICGIYAHLHEIPKLAVGAVVKAGDQIGILGNTGHIKKASGDDGSHLHFELRKVTTCDSNEASTPTVGKKVGAPQNNHYWVNSLGIQSNNTITTTMGTCTPIAFASKTIIDPLRNNASITNHDFNCQISIKGAPELKSKLNNLCHSNRVSSSSNLATLAKK